MDIPYNNISNFKSNIKGSNLFYFHKKLIKLYLYQIKLKTNIFPLIFY
jgi:hypothetical protein